MVNERGGSRIKVLIFVALVVGVIYYAADIVPIFYRYWRFSEQMETEARLAQGMSAEYVRVRIIEEVERIGIPEEAERRLVVQQLSNPPRIQINTTYSESVDLPLFELFACSWMGGTVVNETCVWTFNPRSQAPL